MKRLITFLSLFYIFSSYGDVFLLDRAVSKGHVTTVTALLNTFQDVHSLLNSMEGRTQSPLHIAASKGYIDMGSLLIQYGADIESRDHEGKTPLLSAVEQQHVRFVKMLLDKKADVHAVDIRGRGVLWFIAYNYSSEDEISKLFDRISTDKREAKELIKELVKGHGVNIDAADKEGKTALMAAAAGNKTSAVKALLDHGADIEARDKEGKTALMQVNRSFWRTKDKDSVKTMKVLLDHGADIEARDKYERTPLILYSDRGDFRSVRILVERGADINAKDQFGGTALYEAIRVRGRYSDLAIFLLNHIEKKSNINERVGIAQKTYLMLASERGDTELVKKLLARGANVRLAVSVHDARTALELVRDALAEQTSLSRKRKDSHLIARLKTTRRILKKHIKQQKPPLLIRCKLAFTAN